MNPLQKIIHFFRKGGGGEADERNAKKRRRFTNRKGENVFTFYEDGFSINFHNDLRKLSWSEIEKLTAYKQDRGSHDEICIDILCGNRQITITEETQGWNEFVAKAKQVYPSIDKNWDTKIIFPSFATNLTILYQKTLHNH